MKRLFNMD